jgi:hypothetical protein
MSEIASVAVSRKKTLENALLSTVLRLSATLSKATYRPSA